MSTFFGGAQYTNGGYNSGIPTPGQFNYQPFLAPAINPMSVPGGGANQGPDPLSKYFGNNASSGLDSFSSSNNLGLNSHGSDSEHDSGHDTENDSGNDSGYESGHEEEDSYTPPEPMSDTAMLARFQGLASKLDTQVKPGEDGNLSVRAMQSALKDKSGKYTKEDKQVIQAMLDNNGGIRGKLDHMDGKDDGIIKIDSINKLVVNPDAKQQTPENEMSNTEAANTLASFIKSAIHLDAAGHRADKYVDKHGKLVAPQRGAWTIRREMLQKLSEDEKVSEKVRTAAKKMLQNQELEDTVDNANKGDDPDGKYSLHDFEKAARKSNFDSIGTSETEPGGMKAGESPYENPQPDGKSGDKTGSESGGH
jgi:hypothetical protein